MWLIEPFEALIQGCQLLEDLAFERPLAKCPRVESATSRSPSVERTRGRLTATRRAPRVTCATARKGRLLPARLRLPGLGETCKTWEVAGAARRSRPAGVDTALDAVDPCRPSRAYSHVLEESEATVSSVTVAGASSVLLLAHAGPATAWLAPNVRAALGVRDRVAGQGPAVALTFDDGPHPRGTPAVLSVLAENHAKATFFLVGEQVRRRPALVAEIASAGHEVALHCDRHRNLLRLTPRQTREDLARGEAAIIDVLGYPPRLWRPPYGVLSGAGLLHARRRGLEPVLWSRWGRDWERGATPAGIAARLTEKAGSGDILLLHDADFYGAPGSWRHTVAALPRVLDEIARRGLAPALVRTARTPGPIGCGRKPSLGSSGRRTHRERSDAGDESREDCDARARPLGGGR